MEGPSIEAAYRFCWLRPDGVRIALDALEAALDGALGAGTLAWSPDLRISGDRENGFRDLLRNSRYRHYGEGVRVRTAEVERDPDVPLPQGCFGGVWTVDLEVTARWAEAWALHERADRPLRGLGMQDVSLAWPHLAEALAEALRATDDAGLADFAARCDAVVRAQVRAATRSVDLQRRPYLDLPSLLAEVPVPAEVTHLCLAHDGLTALPEAVRGFTALRQLHVFYNPLASLPPWLDALPALVELNVTATPIGADPEHLAAVRAWLPRCRVLSY